MAPKLDLYRDFEMETIKSELQRARLLMGVFSVGLVMVSLNYFLLEDEVVIFYGGPSQYFMSVAWLATLIIYNFLLSVHIKRLARRGLRVSTQFKIGQTVLEITFVSSLMLYMIDVNNFLLFIDSPVSYVYFLFIILSILHLDFRISILCGALAAVEYVLIVYYGFHVAEVRPDSMPNLPENGYYLRTLLYVLSGAAAGFVSEDVKRRVKSSLEFRNEKKTIERLLGQQVSRDVLLMLTQDDGVVKKSEATVLALDIRNFSAFAETHSPTEIMEYQNKVFGPILELIAQHQGIVNQIMGDGIMATFGSPRKNPLHCDMAFQAAICIVRKIRQLSLEDKIPDTRIGIGIHTGEVVTGNIGNDDRKQYSISGTAVIIAFRVEQLNKELGTEILITEEVRQNIVPGKTLIESVGTKTLRGLGAAVTVHRVEAIQDSKKGVVLQ